MTRDPIDALLDDPAPIPDDGFTQLVMAALPPPGIVRPRRRWLTQLGAGVLAAALAAALTPEAVSLAGLLSAGSTRLVAGLAQALAAGATTLPLQAAGLAVALGAAALGSWLVAKPT